MMRALFRSTKLAVLFAMFFSLFPAVHVAGVFEPAHPGPDIHPDTSTVDKPDDLILAVPAFFVPNLGQMSPDVLFYAQGSGASFAFLRDGIVVSLARGGDGNGINPYHLLQVKYGSTSRNSQVIGLRALPQTINYFLGSEPSRWKTNIPAYAEIVYQDLYPGIDLHYTIGNNGLKGTYQIQPGADPSVIQWAYDGAAGVRLDQHSGDLQINLPLDKEYSTSGAEPGLFVEKAPVAWQEISGRRQPVEVEFAQGEDGSHHFKLGLYRPEVPLVIDPEIIYSTSWGGSDMEESRSIAVDDYGNVYITGMIICGMDSSPVPAMLAPHCFDVYVVKLSADGRKVSYITYLGGSEYERSLGIAVDRSSNVYLTGITQSTNFPTVNPIQAYCKGEACGDVFVTKLDSSGAQLLYSTYLGSRGNEDTGFAITVDDEGSAYITGKVWGPDFPTVNPIIEQCTSEYCVDAFTAKINPAGSQLVFSTYMGSGPNTAGTGITLGNNGDIYVVGYTGSEAFPLVTPYQSSKKGETDAFVVRINPQGSKYLYSTYLGGSRNEYGEDIAVGVSGAIYVTGMTTSEDFPLQNPVQARCNMPLWSNCNDIFVTKINAAGISLGYSTYLGGMVDVSDWGYAIDVDSRENAYVAGVSTAGVPLKNPIQCGSTAGDAYLARLSPSGALEFGSFLGGNAYDIAWGVELYGDDILYIAGETFSRDFPLVHQVQPLWGGKSDAFIAKLRVGSSGLNLEARPMIAENAVYLPILVRPAPPPGRIYGRVTLQGNGSQCRHLRLQYYFNSAWYLWAGTVTGPGGDYTFNSMPTLGSGQKYRAGYRYSDGMQEYLYRWDTADLTAYSARTDVRIGNFDIANMIPLAPDYGANVRLPREFTWQPRAATPTDSYVFRLYELDGDPFWTSQPLGYTGGYTLKELPAGFSIAARYFWDVGILGPDGGAGVPSLAFEIFFRNTGLVDELLWRLFGVFGGGAGRMN